MVIPKSGVIHDEIRASLCRRHKVSPHRLPLPEVWLKCVKGGLWAVYWALGTIRGLVVIGPKLNGHYFAGSVF